MSRFSKLARVAAVAVVVTTALASTPAIAAISYPVQLKVAATGSMETASKGSLIGSGSGTFTVNKSKKLFCYNIKSRGLTGINGSHIHKGAAGVDGVVVIVLNKKKINKVGSTCVKSSASVLADISMNPSNYYFNIHTAKFPAGAVRGQLVIGK
jgi:hypothetical protein